VRASEYRKAVVGVAHPVVGVGDAHPDYGVGDAHHRLAVLRGPHGAGQGPVDVYVDIDGVGGVGVDGEAPNVDPSAVAGGGVEGAEGVAAHGDVATAQMGVALPPPTLMA
jgi:hypothetical protein